MLASILVKPNSVIDPMKIVGEWVSGPTDRPVIGLFDLIYYKNLKLYMYLLYISI